MIIGAIALRRANLEWLKNLRKRFKCLLVIQEPEDFEFRECVDFYFVAAKRLGFGKARRMSMILSSLLDSHCIVTDGDGEYPVSSIVKFANVLSKTHAEVLIPQRTNRVGWVKYEGRRLDRMEFERFEAFCALERLHLQRRRLPTDIDVQPGMFGFKAKVINKILPEDDGWLADWEIAVRALKGTKFALTQVPIDPQPQQVSTFMWDDQKAKLMRLRKVLGKPLADIFSRYEGQMKSPEKEVLKSMIQSMEGSRRSRRRRRK